MNDSKIHELNRFQIVKNIGLTTPLVVLLDIASAHNYKINASDLEIPANRLKLITTLISAPSKIIEEPFTSSDFGYIGVYINGKCRWDKKSLLEAYNYLISFYNPKIFESINSDFIGDYQRPNKINALNPSVVYAICRHHGFEFQYDTSYEFMIETLRSYLNPIPTHKLQENLVNLLCHEFLSRTQIVMLAQLANINMQYLTYVPPKTYDALNDLINSSRIAIADIETIDIKNINDVKVYSYDSFEFYQALEEAIKDINEYQKLEPETEYESIIFAAKEFDIDISFVKAPRAEYLALKNHPYQPIDPLMIRKFNSKLSTDSPRLNEIFNPHLPKALYNERTLIELMRKEGLELNANDVDIMYSTLQEIYLSENFFPGRQPNIINKETYISFSPIIDLAETSIICFGVIGCPMHAFTYEELLDTFNNEKVFLNPAMETPTMFSSDNIKKLLYVVDTDDLDTNSLIKLALGDLIKEINTNISNIPKEILDLEDKYNRTSQTIKYLIRIVFQRFLEVSMYMRGWLGIGPYPIEEAPVYDQDIIDEKVNFSLRKLGETLNELRNLDNSIRRLFLNLPIYKYRDNTYIPSTSIDDGYTIGERLDIVIKGSGGTVSSCIRLTSNWFAATAYRYMNYMKWKPDFDIKKLRHIG